MKNYKIMVETTRWSTEYQPNHVYVFDEHMENVIAYVKQGTKELFKFKRAMPLDRRGRTFEPLEGGSAEPDRLEIKGSKGAIYYLTQTPNGAHCSCPGFTFRGECKHSKGVDNK